MRRLPFFSLTCRLRRHPPPLGEEQSALPANIHRKRPGFRRGASLKTQNAKLKTVYRQTSSPSCTSTVMVLPALRSPRRMVRASRVSTLLCSVRRRGLAP